MFWYVVETKLDLNTKMLDFLNRQENIEAFIPQVEKWFKCTEFEEFQLRDMYPGYIFIKTTLNEESFKEKYAGLFQTVERLGKVIEKDGFISLCDEEIDVLSKLLDNSASIRHSRGKYNGNDLEIFSGPLKGLEKDIQKINRHKKIAKVRFEVLGKEMLLPLEVVNKKGSVLDSA